MRCGSIMLLALAGAMLLGPAGAGAADEHVSFRINLQASSGLSAVLEAQPGEEDRTTLTIQGRRQMVVYGVVSEATGEGVEAHFGRLGTFSTRFSPIRTLLREPPPRCVGKPRVRSEGYFTGTIRFQGERNYVRIEAGRVQGELSVSPEWDCSRRPPPAARSSLVLGRLGDRAEGEEAGLTARLPGADHLFAALGFGDDPTTNNTLFYGAIRESREGMRIMRLAYATTPRWRTFRFDHSRGTATVSPPWPFRGSARFQRHLGGANEWRGRLSVPMLGRPPIRLAGPGFKAHMTDEVELE